MEEEINYATLVLRKVASAPKDKEEEQTIYSVVKLQESAATKLKEKEDRAVISEVNPKELATPLSKVEAAACCHSRLLLVCLGILCVVLAVTIVAMAIYIIMGMNKQEANLSAENQQLMEVLKNQTEQLTADIRVLKNQTEQLTADNRVLKNQTEQLTADNRVLKNRTELMTVEIGNLENQTKHLNRQKDDLNWTLGVILTFNSFPVKEFCPDKQCQPCQGGWILYQKKCYLFYDKPAPWKTWTQSQTYCKDSGADLVVIDNQQEQEFISNNTKYYHSEHHGYWIGLKESNGNFFWIDGRRNTLGYWLETGGSGSYVLVIPDKSPTQSWKRSSPEFQLKFICESEALIRLN
ncbi:uncharacterized protein PAE49_005798 isoform 2-T2 [Odontesthes bonariensis]|uniref:uncharacterized protein LOC142380447 isoform X2 n=1 Tax=Odontesthes bonariensis TaxID=219752 RepID=UPI003F5881C3